MRREASPGFGTGASPARSARERILELADARGERSAVDSRAACETPWPRCGKPLTMNVALPIAGMLDLGFSSDAVKGAILARTEVCRALVEEREQPIGFLLARARRRVEHE